MLAGVQMARMLVLLVPSMLEVQAEGATRTLEEEGWVLATRP